jgi:arylsulfatase A-like enzyme
MPIRSGWSKVFFTCPQGVAPWEYSMARPLGDAGYQSLAHGKWHLGDVQGRFTSDLGLGERWGFSHSSDKALRNNQPSYSTDMVPLQPIYGCKKGNPP